MSRPGDNRLSESISRYRNQARRDAPKPYDDDWGWWIEQRLEKLESGQKWIIGLAISTLVATIAKTLL